MLNDEQMEDRKCMQQECMSYQAIVNGIGDECSPQPSLCREQQRRRSAGFTPSEFKQKHGTAREEEDYGWIDDVLVASLSSEGEQAWTLEQIDSIFSGVEQDSKQWAWPLELSSSSSSEQDMKVWSLDSSLSSSPYSQDSPTGLLERISFGVAPAAVTLPSSKHTFIAPSLPNAPSLQEFLQKEMVHLNADLLPDFRHSMTQDFTDLQRVISLDVAGNNTLSFVKKETVFERNDSVEGANQVQTERPPDEQPLSFVKNEYLNAEKHAKIYGDWSPAQDACTPKKKQNRNGKAKRNGKPEPVDLRSLLVDCAQAVGANNLRKANEIVQELRQHVSPHGSASQRVAHYFTEGLVARLAGTGAQLYTAMSNNRPSAANMLKAFRLIVEVCPYAKLAHLFANQNILKVAEGASRVHIVDYGILYGVQWPCLISALAERKGGPPFLRITGIEFPQPGVNPAERVEETGRRLAEYAKAYNVPFEYQAIASKWEDIEPAALNLQEGEVLVVNCIQRLRHLLDETVMSPSPRRKVLSRMHSLNPDIVLIAVSNAGYNAPFFVSRFREALYHFSSKFDMIETTVGDGENPQRMMIEGECLGRDILNVVACEGHERLERPETYRQWQARFQRAGFVPLTLGHSVLTKARDVVKAFYHKDFTVDDDSKWMLLGWKGRIVEGLSAWKPSASSLVI